MRCSLVSSKMTACDVLVNSLSAHTNTPETEACMFRRAFVHVAFCTCEEWRTGRYMLSLFYFFSALASVDFDCERMRLHITCEAVPPQRNRQSFGPVNFARTTTSMKPSCSYASASVYVLGFHYDLL